MFGTMQSIWLGMMKQSCIKKHEDECDEKTRGNCYGMEERIVKCNCGEHVVVVEMRKSYDKVTDVDLGSSRSYITLEAKERA